MISSVQVATLLGVSSEDWQQIELSWQRLDTQIRHWQWMLDTALPGALGQIGEWLNNAEHVLCGDDVPQVLDDEAANVLKVKLDQHKQLFGELGAVQASFEHNAAAATTVPPLQIQDIGQRLSVLPQKAAQRASRLRFLEHKCCILAFLDLTDNKLKAWSVRYGTEETIALMLEQYRAFVSRNKLFHEFDKAFKEMQQVSNFYWTLNPTNLPRINKTVQSVRQNYNR